VVRTMPTNTGVIINVSILICAISHYNDTTA
jgi:hypothetical protein